MRFFDIVAIDYNSLDRLAERLGYKKVFRLGSDVEIAETLKEADSNGKKIVRSDRFEVVAKSLRRNEVLGALPYNDTVSRKVLEIIKKEDKFLFIPISSVICADDAVRIQKLVRTRAIIRNALAAKVKICLVSLAEKREGIVSS
ncbi:MAG: hypothetical protein ABSD68_03530, partial [Candidatus Micrarchaeales archaeon]